VTYRNTANGARALTQETMASFAGRVAVPTYDRDRLTPAIVHIGVGGFHRAHQAVYLDDLAEQRITTEWGERGVGLLPGDRQMAEALGSQDGLYTLVARDAHDIRARIIGSLTQYLFGPDDPERVLQALSDAGTRIVSLTITEGGYNVDQHTGAFDVDNPAIQQDLAGDAPPSTVFGYLCAALGRRRAAGLAPFTVLSCDNLPGNGTIAKSAVVAFARLRDDTLAAWIDESVAFPNGMVDRITPRTTDADRAMVAQTFGIRDRWPVMTEPFAQWVLEDTFCNGRPPLEDVGVQVVTDVGPYETMKLRLLNASHQALGYLGYLAGYRYVHEVMGDDLFRTFIARMMDDEVTALLPPVPGIDLTHYKRTLLERFANPKIGDTLARICTDGSDRMPKFLLPSLAEALSAGRPHRLLVLAVAGWFRYLRGEDEQGRKIAIVDPLADDLRARANKGKDDPRPLLALRPIFGTLGESDTLVQDLEQALRQLNARGAKDTVSSYLA
jgi:mannitol 2-dehydrogenase